MFSPLREPSHLLFFQPLEASSVDCDLIYVDAPVPKLSHIQLVITVNGKLLRPNEIVGSLTAKTELGLKLEISVKYHHHAPERIRHEDESA